MNVAPPSRHAARLLLPPLLLGLGAACGPRGERFFADEPPTAPTLGLVPAAPITGDALQVDVRARSTDPEEDEVTLRFAWTRDGVAVRDLDGPLVPAGRLVRGETWAVTVTPTDGTLDGPPATVEVVVGNAGPVLRSIRLSPTAPRAGDVLVLEIDGDDPEGDPLQLEARWTIDGAATPTDDPLRLTAPLVRGDVVEVTVVGSDGALSTETRRASVTVGNTPPTAPGLELLPVEPRPVRDDLVCRVVVPPTDADGDRLTTTLSWEKDGVPFQGAATDVDTTVVTAAQAGDGHTWRCFGVAHDGHAASPRAELAVTDRGGGVGELLGHVEIHATATLAFTVDDEALCGEPSCDCTAELTGYGELVYADHDQDVYTGTWTVTDGDCAPWFGSATRTVADLWLVPPGSPYLAVAFDATLSHVTGLRVFGDLHADRAPTSTPDVLALPADVDAVLSGSASGVTSDVPLGAGGADGRATIAWTVTPSP